MSDRSHSASVDLHGIAGWAFIATIAAPTVPSNLASNPQVSLREGLTIVVAHGDPA